DITYSHPMLESFNRINREGISIRVFTYISSFYFIFIMAIRKIDIVPPTKRNYVILYAIIKDIVISVIDVPKRHFEELVILNIEFISFLLLRLGYTGCITDSLKYTVAHFITVRFFTKSDPF